MTASEVISSEFTVNIFRTGGYNANGPRHVSAGSTPPRLLRPWPRRTTGSAAFLSSLG